jgi:peroxiredoxin
LAKAGWRAAAYADAAFPYTHSSTLTPNPNMPNPTDLPINVGQTAPDFTLMGKTPEGLKPFSLGAHQGQSPVVLLFFPFAFTGVCTQELCAASQGLGLGAQVPAVVYGISVDSPFSQEAWAQQHNIRVQLLSDFNKTVCTAYGVVYPELLGFQGVAKRSAFVIDTQGKVAWAWVSDDPKALPDFEALQACLQQLAVQPSA